MSVRARPAPILAAILLAGALGLSACTPYQPVVPSPGQSWVEARAAAQRAAARVAAERAAARTHRVRDGESVGVLARRYEVPAGEIIAANKLAKPYTLKTGQTLLIPGGRSETPPRPGPDSPTSLAPEHARREAMAAAGAAEPQAPAAEAGGVRIAALEPPSPTLPAAPPATARPPERAPAARTPLPEPDAQTLRRAQAATPPPLSGEGFLQPVAGRLVSGFGEKRDGRRNDGINLAAPLGTAVRAAENGIVVYAGESIPGFGRLLLIRHGDGFTTAYGHLDQVLVTVGERVERGQVVARVGDTGDVKSAQLHFQLRSGATPIDPRPHLVAGGVQMASGGAARGPGG